MDHGSLAPGGSEGGRGWGMWLLAGIGVFLIGVLGGVAGIMVAVLTGVVDANLGSAGDNLGSVLAIVMLAAALILGLAVLLARAARRGRRAPENAERARTTGF